MRYFFILVYCVLFSLQTKAISLIEDKSLSMLETEVDTSPDINTSDETSVDEFQSCCNSLKNYRVSMHKRAHNKILNMGLSHIDPEKLADTNTYTNILNLIVSFIKLRQYPVIINGTLLSKDSNDNTIQETIKTILDGLSSPQVDR